MDASERRKVNPKTFIEDYARGLSDEELRKKFSLDHSQLTRVVEVLKKRGELTDDCGAERRHNLKIRFGSEQGPPDAVKEGKVAVDVSTGLVLHCPSCGAAVQRDSENCRYCSAPLDFLLKGKTIICPHCFASTPADGNFCMKCAQQVKGLIKEGLVLNDTLCPRCNVPMRGLKLGEFIMTGCAQCNGVFVPHDVFEMMQQVSQRFLESFRGIKKATNVNAEVHYVRCPVCRNIMNRKNFSGISGVIVDTCRDDGIWFDAGDMEQVMDFIAHGGLKKAKDLELERKKDVEKLQKIKNIEFQKNAEYGGYDLFSPGQFFDIVDAFKWLCGLK